jgi:heptosyltransferase-1
LARVFVWPRRRWRQLWRERQYLQYVRELRELVAALRAERFDLILDLQGLLKSGVWALLAGGKTRIGLGSREGSQYWMHRVISRRSDSPRIGKEYLKLARELGIEPDRFDMDIEVSAGDRAQAERLLAEAGVAGRYIVLAPFTTRPQKHWFDERWAELAKRLRAERGLICVMLGGPGDKAHALAITAQTPEIIDLTGKTSLTQCAAMIAQAMLVIGVDTGLTHLGIAQKTPTLALFGSTRPYLDPAFSQTKVLYSALECSPCRRRPTCHNEFTCMQAHSVDSVFEAAAGLLEVAS